MLRALRRQAIACLFAVLFVACGEKEAEPDGTASESMAEAEESQPAAAADIQAAAGNPVSAPLTPEDIRRWELGMAGEMKAVEDAAARMKTARNGEDTLSVIMGVQETATIPAGAQAAGMDQERYKFVRSNLSAVVAYLTPPELEGMDTTKMPQNLRDEFRTGRAAQLERMGEVVPPEVIESLKPRAAELRKRDMQLVGARLKGAGM